MKRNITMMIVIAMFVILFGFLSESCYSCAESEATDWKYAINKKDNVKLLFENEYEKPMSLYTTTYLNMRTFPNVLYGNIEKVLPPNTKVKAVAEYNGWTKIAVEEKKQIKNYYLWNEYISEDKPTKEYLGNFILTGYCWCEICCGEWSGTGTASGTTPVQGRTIAMNDIPFGTKIMIGDNIYTVEDRGTPYGHIDIYFDSHEEALNFGIKTQDVYEVLE